MENRRRLPKQPSGTIEVGDVGTPPAAIPVSDPPWLEYADDKEGVREHCVREGICDEMQICVDLVRKHFDPIMNLKVYVDYDPEGGGAWAATQVTKHCTVPEASSAYHRYLDEWIPAMTPDVLGKIVVLYRVG